MSWFKTAFALIREAVETEAGREVISNVRAAIRKDSSQSPPLSLADVEALVAEYKTQMNSSIETLIHELNAQNQKLTETVRRQRAWNFALTVGIVAAVLITFLT